jgi:drug/metabolite transporter (DMT)-like permease
MMSLDNNIKAIFLILLGMFVFSIQDTLIKLISDSINIYVIYITRSIVGLIAIIIFCRIRKIKLVFKTYYPVITILRVSGFFLGFSLYYFSLSKITWPEAVTLFFVSPFFVTIASKFIIGETIGLYRWSAIFIGFSGVYLVLDPDFNNFNIYSLFPILCAFFYALTVVIQKKTSDHDSLFTQIIHTYVSAIIFSIIIYVIINNLSFSSYQLDEYNFILMSWSIPSTYSLLILLIIGFTGVVGFFSLFGAYRIGSPSTIAPYEYSLIIWSIIFGYFIWNDLLSSRGFVGLLLILLASFFTLYREYILSIKVNTDKHIR